MTDIGKKVEHVKRARQTRSHECHWPGCTKQVAPALWGCKAHWFKLPREIRSAIWVAYSIGKEENGRPSRAYVEAARRAQEFAESVST